MVELKIMASDKFHILCLGGGGSGKDDFQLEAPPMVDNIACKMELLHTSGDSQFSSMQDQWMSRSDGYLIFYNIVSRSTLDEAIIIRDKVLRAKNSTDEAMIFVGTNIENQAQRQVSKSDVEQLIKQWNSNYCQCCEISVKENSAIDQQRVSSDVIRLCRKKNARESSTHCCNIL